MKHINSIWLILAWSCINSINLHGSSLPTLPSLPSLSPTTTSTSSSTLPTLPSLTPPKTTTPSPTTTTSTTSKPTTSTLPTLPSLSPTNTVTPKPATTTTSSLPTLPTLTPTTPTNTVKPATTTVPTAPTTTTTTSTTGSQSSAAATSVSETIMPIIHIQNNASEEGTLKEISIQISNPKTKKSISVTGTVQVKLPAKAANKPTGPVIAFNPTIHNSPFSPEFNGVKSITIDSSTITFPKMFSGLSAIHAINVTKENGKWVLDKTVHTKQEKTTTLQQVAQPSTTKNTITQSTAPTTSLPSL